MNYKQIYKDLIISRKLLNRKKGPQFELHHIRMLQLGGIKECNNEILLTFREHHIAHLLLDNMYHNHHTEEALLIFKKTALFMCDTKLFINSSRFISKKRSEFYENVKKMGEDKFADYIKPIRKVRAKETAPRVYTSYIKKEKVVDEFTIKIPRKKRKTETVPGKNKIYNL